MNENQAEQSQKRMGKTMVFAMWILLLGLLTMFFSNWIDRQHNPNRTLQSQTRTDGAKETVLKRNRYGHYVASGMINGSPVVFMLDTGATDISIPAHIADRLGLKRGLKITYHTANGLARGYATRLESVSLGHIELRNVPASINPNVKDEDILLGMSFLKHLEFTQRGDTLTLRQ